MTKSLRILAVVVIAASFATPFLSKAEEVDTTPGTGKSVVKSWVQAEDGTGDANSIGKFKSAKENKKYVRVNGTVTAVSETSVTIEKGSTSYTYVVDANTAVIRRFKGKASIGEVSVGDVVSIWTTKKADGTAKLIWDKSIWRISVTGAVADLDTTAQTFNVVIEKKEPHTGLMMTLTVPVRTSSDTTYFIGDTAASFSDLTNGQTVKVRGTWNIEGKYEMASKVIIVPS